MVGRPLAEPHQLVECAPAAFVGLNERVQRIENVVRHTADATAVALLELLQEDLHSELVDVAAPHADPVLGLHEPVDPVVAPT